MGLSDSGHAHPGHGHRSGWQAHGDGSWDSQIRLWSLETKEQIGTLKGHKRGVIKLAFSPDGKTLASGGATGEGSVMVWDVASRTVRHTLKGTTESVSDLAFSPNGAMLSCSRDWKSGSQIWDNQNRHADPMGQRARTVLVLIRRRHADRDGFDDRQPLEHENLGAETGAAGAIQIARPGLFARWEVVACGCWDGTVRVWDAASGALLHVLKNHVNLVDAVAYSPDGATLASTSDQVLCLVDTHTWALKSSTPVGGIFDGNTCALGFLVQ